MRSSTSAGTLAVLAVLVIGGRAIAQTKTVGVCVDQLNGDADTPGDAHVDADRLAKELSGRELANGEVMRAVVITEKKASAVNARIEREGCAYLVRTWRHSSLDTGEGNVPLVHDMDTLVFEVRDLKSRKVIASGQTFPPTVYAKQGHRLYWPYPIIAKRITAKLK